MNRFLRAGLTAAALIAVAPPLTAAETAEAERAFAVAARGFTSCLLYAADSASEQKVDLAGACLAQEAAFRRDAIRLRMARGQAEQQAITEAETDILDGRRTIVADKVRRYALAN